MPLTKERRRSISPPLPPQMSPDNGRPLPHLTQTNSQRLFGDQNESAKQSKTSTRSQVIYLFILHVQSSMSFILIEFSYESINTTTNSKVRLVNCFFLI